MLTRQQVREMRSRIEPFLDAISDEVGYKLTLGSCRFGEVATFKLDVAPIGKDGQPVSKMSEDFKRRARLFGLKDTDLGRTFIHQDRTFTICGLSPRKGRYPILATTVSGKVYKFSILFVQSVLAPKKEVENELRRRLEGVKK